LDQAIKAKCIEYDPADGKTRLSLKQLQERPAGDFGGAGGFDDRPPRRPHGSGGHSGPRRGPPRR
jgi:hypothetical protein